MGTPMQISLVTETFLPEVNGVAMTLGRTVRALRERGHAVQIIRPRQTDDGKSPSHDDVVVPGLPLPVYPGLHFGLPAGRRLRQLWTVVRPDLVHIATEGPLGLRRIYKYR